MFYEGPGIYQHWKGGHYRVIGVAMHESTGAKVVIYHSYSIAHDTARIKEGVDFVCRPLNARDGENAFNTRSESGQPRFVKIV